MDIAAKFIYWSQLTPEMKSECVKHLDFLTRIKFRNMSKSDQAVVNSTKFDVEKVSITNDSYGEFLEIEVNKEDKFKMMAEDQAVLVNQMVPLLAFVIKCGVIDEFVCDIDDLPESAINVLRECGQMRFKIINGRSSAQMLLFLEQCLGSIVESVSLSTWNGVPVPFDRIMAIGSLRKVKRWNLQTVEEDDCLTRMAQRWIDVDAEEGTELCITVPRISTAFTNFSTAFRDRIEDEEAGRKIRIRLNGEKHISLHSGTVGHYRLFVRSARSRSPIRRAPIRIF